MKRLLNQKLETLATIAVLALFALGVIVTNGMKKSTDPASYDPIEKYYSPRDSSPVFVQNTWKGKSYTKELEFDENGVLPLNELIGQMYDKMFPASSTRALREGPRSAAELPHWVHVVARHKDGAVFLDVWGHNLRTNAGINWQYNQMAGTAAAVANYIAVTNTAITPNATDTTLSGEITLNGLARAGPITSTTYNVHSANATSYQLSNIFTCASTAQAAQAAGVFNAGSSGTMVFENTFAQASLQVGDTLNVQWTVTF